MQVTRTFDLLPHIRKNYSETFFLAGKNNGLWEKFSIDQYQLFANQISYGLLSLGLKTGACVAMIANNRPEWNFVDMGISQAGMINVPIYPTISDDDYSYILKHCEPRVVFISDNLLYARLKPIIATVKSVIAIYTFNNVEGANNWSELLNLGRENGDALSDILINISLNVDAQDIATIIYTSGTTGIPKGVMLTHKNLVSNFIITSSIHPFGTKERVLSFLPLSHVYERMLNCHFQYKGTQIYYAENMGTIVENIKEVKPHIFSTVPRLLETVYDKIIGKGEELSFPLKQIFFWAVRLGLRFELNRANGWWYHVKLNIAERLVFRKWRDALGGEVRIIASGGAALQPRLSRIFWAAGIHVLEGYGLTETSPVISVNHLTKNLIRFGTVGPVIDETQVKISDDGEILCKGPGLMKGYYKAPELTSEVIDADGWFHTGDVGVIEDGLYLRISDRKKEIFKLSSGKYIAPQVIENKLKESIFIEQVMVVGENQKFASALISPNYSYLHNWAFHHKIEYRDNIDLINKKEVVEIFSNEIVKCNSTIGQSEQIKKFKLVLDEWTADNGILSPTLKLKRKIIFEKYADTINEIYSILKEEEDSLLNRLGSEIRKGIKNGFNKVKTPFIKNIK